MLNTIMNLHLLEKICICQKQCLSDINDYYIIIRKPKLRAQPRAKLIRSTSLQLLFDVAVSKLLWRLVSLCFYMSICFFSTIRLK